MAPQQGSSHRSATTPCPVDTVQAAGTSASARATPGQPPACEVAPVFVNDHWRSCIGSSEWPRRTSSTTAPTPSTSRTSRLPDRATAATPGITNVADSTPSMSANMSTNAALSQLNEPGAGSSSAEFADLLSGAESVLEELVDDSAVAVPSSTMRSSISAQRASTGCNVSEVSMTTAANATPARRASASTSGSSRSGSTTTSASGGNSTVPQRRCRLGLGRWQSRCRRRLAGRRQRRSDRQRRHMR